MIGKLLRVLAPFSDRDAAEAPGEWLPSDEQGDLKALIVTARINSTQERAATALAELSAPEIQELERIAREDRCTLTRCVAAQVARVCQGRGESEAERQFARQSVSEHSAAGASSIPAFTLSGWGDRELARREQREQDAHDLAVAQQAFAAPGRLRTYWETLEGCGWLSDLREERLSSLRLQLWKAYTASPRRAHEGLREVSFEDDPLIDEESLSGLLEIYAQASHGAFSPGALAVPAEGETLEDGFFRARFTLVGRRCELEVPFDCKVDVLHAKVNATLEEIGETRRFLLLPMKSPLLGIAFVHPAAFECAIERGLIGRQRRAAR